MVPGQYELMVDQVHLDKLCELHRVLPSVSADGPTASAVFTTSRAAAHVTAAAAAAARLAAR
eukprot:1090289-Prymnesium_polylepis.1